MVDQQVPRAKPGMVCPLHRKDMSKVCHKCPWWTEIQGTHPQTGDRIDSYSCAIAWGPVLLVDAARQSASAGAAVESLRNQFMAALGRPNGVKEVEDGR